MGWTRACGDWEVRFFRDNPDLITTISTYFVPDDTPMSPYATIFAPNQWQRGEYMPFPGINYLEYSYFNGDNVWNCPATSFVGDRRQWYEGPLSTDPVPVYNEDSICPVSCGCLGNPFVTCGFVPFAESKVCRVTIAGATGSAAAANGVWDVNHNVACQWQESFSGGTNLIEIDLADIGPPGAYVSCFPDFSGAPTVFYEAVNVVDFSGLVVLTRSGASPVWPATITIAFVAV